MDDNKNINAEPLTKNEKAYIAGRDVAEVAARGAGRYYGGALGGAAVDAALKTKSGQKIVGQASKQINKNPITRSVLAKNHQNISRAKPMANSVINNINGVKDSLVSKVSSARNNGSEINEEGVATGGWNRLDFKVKLIIIGAISSLVLIIVFFVVLIAPFINLGIIDIGGIGSSSNRPSNGNKYSSVSGNTTYWWPVGSDNTSTTGGIKFASDEPGSSKISSNYGMRIHPITGEQKKHKGVDISNGSSPGTTNIIAVKDGTVIYPSTNDVVDCPTSSSLDSCGGGWGNYVKIQHNDGTVTLYAHLYENSITVSAGDVVKQGQVIGKMGSSGNSTGNHLHFEVHKNGQDIDPLGFINIDNTRPQSGIITYVNGNSNKQSVCLTLKNAGFSDNSVAALLTNIASESSFNPTSIGDSGTSYGLCQWHNSRNADLKAAYPDSYHTIDSQINFLMYELENKYVSLNDALVNGTGNTSDLTYSFCANFERPADTKNTCNNRANKAESYYQYVINGCN